MAAFHSGRGASASASLIRRLFCCIKKIDILCKTSIIDATTGDVKTRVPYSELREKFGYPYYLYHRVDLHNGLKEMATRTVDGDNGEVTLLLSSEVVEIDCESGTLTLKDGSKVSKDLLVMADGVHVSVSLLINSRSFDVDDSPLKLITVQICQRHKWEKCRCRGHWKVFIPVVDITQAVA